MSCSVPFHRWTRPGGPGLSPATFFPVGTSGQGRTLHLGAPPRPQLPRARTPTWRGRHGLQAGICTAVVTAAPLPRALRVGLAAHRLAGVGGQRARGRRAAVRAGLLGAASFLALQREGSISGAQRPQPAGPTLESQRCLELCAAVKFLGLSEPPRPQSQQT